MHLVILVINLSSSKLRRERMEKRLNYYNLDAIFISAIDNKSSLVDWYICNQGSITRWEISGRNEVACYLSHLKAIRTGLQDYPEADYYFILEDDALFRDDFFEHLPKWLQENFDVIVPCGQNFVSEIPRNTCQEGLSWVHRERWGTWSAVGYLISQSYAQKALQYFDQPLRYLPYPRLVSEIIYRQAPKAVYTEDVFILEDGYDSTIRNQDHLHHHRKWFESKYDYRRFLSAEGISYEEFKEKRRLG